MFRILFAMVSMFVFPQYSHFETLILSVLVLGEKVFGRWSGHKEELSRTGLVPL